MTDKPKIVLADPHQVPVTFVNQVVNSGHLNGVANVTLAVANFSPQPDGTIVPDLAVAVRLRMDMFCAAQLRDALSALIEQSLKTANGTSH